MHGSRLLDVGRGKHKRLNGKQEYSPKEGFVKRSADQAKEDCKQRRADPPDDKRSLLHDSVKVA